MTTKKMGRSGDDRAALKTTDNAHFTLSSARIKLVRWLCRKLCRYEFFNFDASLEIDALTIELEKLRAAGKKR